MKVTYKRAGGKRPRQIVAAVAAAARAAAALVQTDYEGVVENWNTPVDFGVEDRSAGSSIKLNIYARGENTDIFIYVDQGTKTRYAVMRPTFNPRTTPGSLRSQASGGDRRVSYFDYDPIMAARRAIEAREFGRIIVENRRREFVDGIRKALRP